MHIYIYACVCVCVCADAHVCCLHKREIVTNYFWFYVYTILSFYLSIYLYWTHTQTHTHTNTDTHTHTHTHTHIYIYHHHVVPLHGYRWPSLATSPYYSAPLVGLQGYILCPHIAAVCMFELVVLLLLGHMWGSIYIYIYICIERETDRGINK